VDRDGRRPEPVRESGRVLQVFRLLRSNWDWKTFDFDKDVKLADERFAKLLNAVDPDLGAFKKHGGKLIMYHGWNDQLIQPYNSIDYFTSVQKKLGTRETDDFARLFMAPGMQHCAGGGGTEHARRRHRARAVGGGREEAGGDRCDAHN